MWSFFFQDSEEQIYLKYIFVILEIYLLSLLKLWSILSIFAK